MYSKTNISNKIIATIEQEFKKVKNTVGLKILEEKNTHKTKKAKYYHDKRKVNDETINNNNKNK